MSIVTEVIIDVLCGVAVVFSLYCGWKYRTKCPKCDSSRFRTVHEYADYEGGTGVTYTHECSKCKASFTSFRDWLDFH